MLGGGYFIYIMHARLCWYLKYGIHKHISHVTHTLEGTAAHIGRILQRYVSCSTFQLTFKDWQKMFSSVWDKKTFKKLVPSLKMKLRTSQYLFPALFCKRLMSKIHIIKAFESLTCLTFTVLSAEALLYSLLMTSRLHLGWSTSMWLSENSPLKLETVTGFY